MHKKKKYAKIRIKSQNVLENKILRAEFASRIKTNCPVRYLGITNIIVQEWEYTNLHAV